MRVRQMFQFPVVLDPRWLLMRRLLLRRMVSVISPEQMEREQSGDVKKITHKGLGSVQ